MKISYIGKLQPEADTFNTEDEFTPNGGGSAQPETAEPVVDYTNDIYIQNEYRDDTVPDRRPYNPEITTDYNTGSKDVDVTDYQLKPDSTDTDDENSGYKPLDPNPNPKPETDLNEGAKTYHILTSADILNLPLMIQCTFANAYTEPRCNPGLCIRSFDRAMLKQLGSKNNVIGTSTGRYFAMAGGPVWMEANLNYTNRSLTGWFNQRDIWHARKGTEPNPADVEPKTETKKGWLGWITAGITLLSFLK